MKDPEAARRRTLELFTLLGELNGAEQVVMPVLLDAVMIVQAYRRATRFRICPNSPAAATR